jgi:alkyl sulfatase BDS1-like metallo-beta-lactamase superfamily hydrolase
MGTTLDYADRLWRGEESIGSGHQLVFVDGGLEEVADDVAFLPTFANVSAMRTDDGLFLVDSGSEFMAAKIHGQIRGWTDAPLHTAVFSHGHVDHVFGVGRFEAEAREKGWRPPQVVAHEAMPARFDRYKLTAGYNAVINQRQFQVPDLKWPLDYRYPDITYRNALSLKVGGVDIELHHARGETDDHTWTWIPSKRVLCSGDLFIWAAPNAGNPQKVQRYPIEWARALHEMAALGAEVLLPGHGVPVVGADRVKTALLDTAELLESLHDQTIAMMNDGARLDDIIHSVQAPAHLLAKPYLKPVYDEPEFVVRNTWRLYGGWYDGNPATLKPAPDAAVARELASLAGGAAALADRASALLAAGDDASLRLAGNLAEIASLAAPDDAGVHAVRAAVFGKRAEVEASTMAKGVFAWAAAESTRAAGPPTS